MIGPRRYRKETHRIYLHNDTYPNSSGGNSKARYVTYKFNEQTRTSHVLKACALGATSAPSYSLVLVTNNVSALPPGYFYFEYSKDIDHWKRIRNDFGNASGEDEAPHGHNYDIDQAVVLPPGVKLTDMVSFGTLPTRNDARSKEDVGESSGSKRSKSLCFMKTLGANEFVLKQRDIILKKMRYLLEDAWVHYRQLNPEVGEGENDKGDSSSENAFDISVGWFLQPVVYHEPLSLNGEMSSGENSSDEEEEIHENADEDQAKEETTKLIERDSKEAYLRCVLSSRIARRSNSNSTNIIISGYLLKKSRKDPNVWRRNFCILVDNQLWYISRMRLQAFYMQGRGNGEYRYIWRSKHRHIRLLRSHVTEPVEGSLNERIPHVIEIRTGQNEMHVFQAVSRHEQLKWIQAIAGQIVVRHESNYIEMAELIMCEEQEARTRRFEESVCQVLDKTGIPTPRGTNVWSMTGQGGEIVDLVRFTMLIHEFKEVCRTHSGLPASVGSRQWKLNRILVARQLDAAGAVCASPFFKERTQDDKEFKTQRKQIVHTIVEKQKRLNQTDEALAPPLSTIFDDVLRKLTAYTVEAEERHKENGLFGYVVESPTRPRSSSS